MTSTLTIRGATVPSFWYGTAWKEERTEGLVLAALDAGFRAIDTANQRKHYYEEGVGRALRQRLGDGALARQDLFVQTKFTFQDGQDHRLPYDPKAAIGHQVMQSFRSSLEHLGVDYLDSLILHGPSRAVGLGREDHEAWQAIEALAKSRSVRFIGVSNVSAEQLLELLAIATVRPAFVQNRCYASRSWDRAVRAICAQHDLAYQGFSLLTANRAVVASPSVVAIAARHGVTPAQVIFRFARQLGMIPLTGTSDPRHMQQDLAIDRFALTPDDVAVIEASGGR